MLESSFELFIILMKSHFWNSIPLVSYLLYHFNNLYDNSYTGSYCWRDTFTHWYIGKRLSDVRLGCRQGQLSNCLRIRSVVWQKKIGVWCVMNTSKRGRNCWKRLRKLKFRGWIQWWWEYGSTSVYVTLHLLYHGSTSLWIYINLPWFHFTLLDSTLL